MNFPYFNTKKLGDPSVSYNLNDPIERRKYFEAKLGTKIDDMKEFLEKNTFVAFLLAKKSAGKGTYSKMFAEVVGEDRVAHLSVGDLVRDTHKYVEESDSNKQELLDYLNKPGNYRGFMSVEDGVEALLGRSQSKLLPTEFILALVKKEIEKIEKKALFIDGLPRNLDQISYSLFFRDLINFRDDPDLFILVDVPEAVIDERMKYRVVCPVCHTSRNIKLLPTKFVKKDIQTGEYYLVCDNSACSEYAKARMVRKDGDEKGIEPIRERLELDGKLMEMATSLHGVPMVFVRNSMPVEAAKENACDYELTPEFYYEDGADSADGTSEEVAVKEKPWIIKDDVGEDCHSLMAASALVSLFSQMHKILIGK
jgi:adenylate kinase family enzyme